MDEQPDLLSLAPGLRVSDLQRQLLEALNATNHMLGNIYRSGLECLQREDLPDQAAIVAHEFRELMEKLPRAFDLPVHTSVQLRPRLRGLATSLERAKAESRSYTDDNWDGEIDEPLRGFLSDAERLFEEAEADLRSRREAATALVRAGESGRAPMPEALEKREVNTWNDLEVYFQNVSHHRHQTTVRELEAQVGDLEGLLVSRLKVAAIEEYDEIDRLVEEGEADA